MRPPDAPSPATLAWLLEPDVPSVRYRTLTELLGRSPRSREVREARAAIMERGAVPALLAKQRADGSFGAPGAFYTDRYRGTAWQLIVLAAHRADGRDPRIRSACELVLALSQDPGTGGFSYRAAGVAEGGDPDGVIPCLTGNVVWSLHRLGLGDDARVARGVDWLTRYLRFDDGDTAPPRGWRYRRREACYGHHSCFMGVVKGLKALAEVPPARRSAAVRRTLEAGAEFLLRHHVYKRSHDLRRVARPGWRRFGFPRMYQTDTLEITRLLLDLGCRDPRLGAAIALVRRRAGAGGRWRLDEGLDGRTLVRLEREGAPSKWITLDALLVLKEAAGVPSSAAPRRRHPVRAIP